MDDRQIFEIAVIGSGGGTYIADHAVKSGTKVALIEATGWGGTCLRRGCIPTKIMVHAADVIQESKHAAAISLDGPALAVNWDSLKNRVFAKIQEGDGMVDYYAPYENIHLYKGQAALEGKEVIDGEDYFCLTILDDEGEETEILAGKVVLANGGHTNIPANIGLDEIPYSTSETLFNPETWPAQMWKSVVILGGGDIGCEFAHIFSSFGAKVTIVQHNARLVPKQDGEISDRLLQILQAQGVDVLLGQDTLDTAETEEGKIVFLRNIQTGEEHSVCAEEIFVCPGIRPNVQSLNLMSVGLDTEPNRGWVKTNEYLETEIPGLYAIGDINGKYQFRHKANYDGEILAHNIIDAKDQPKSAWRKVEYELTPSGTFTALQIGRVGITEEEAKRRQIPYKVGYLPFSATAQGYARGFLPETPNDGFAKVIVREDTQEILGVHCLAPEAASLVQPFVYLMYAARHPELSPADVRILLQAMTIHPSLSELPAWAFGAWRER